MDSLQVGPSNSSKSSSRSTSPCRQHAAPAAKRPGDASSGSSCSGTNITMSNSVKGRRRSPVASGTKRDRDKSWSETGTPQLSRQDASLPSEDAPSTTEEDTEVYHPSSSVLSNGSSEHMATLLSTDDPDGPSSSAVDLSKTKAAIEHMQTKIDRTKDLIRGEQTSRDDNVNEYLKLAANADKQQLARIKAVFEKKNQKSAQSISQLQKKLESYNRRLRELEMHGVSASHRQPKEVLRDMGQGLKNVGGNIRDGISGLSGTVMSKPREFAHLIKNKFGSADNINTLTRSKSKDKKKAGTFPQGKDRSIWYIDEERRQPSSTNRSWSHFYGNGDSSSVEDEKAHHGSATLPGGCSLVSTQGSSSAGAIKLASDEGSECSSVTSESLPQQSPHHHTSHYASVSGLEPLFNELQERREEFERLREEVEGIKSLQQDVNFLNQSLQEERFRSERLEEQVNDLTELHQNEVENLKQAISDMEEKVQYQSEERLRDIHEMLECCQTKISKMEHQQQQHQQYVTLEGIDNSNARALVVKLINVVLTVLQVVLLLVATAAGIVMPFLRTRLRILSTIILVAGFVFVLKQWPEVQDVGDHLMRHIKQALSVK